MQSSHLYLRLPEGSQPLDYLIRIGPSIEYELRLKYEPILSDGPSNRPIKREGMLRLDLKTIVVALCDFVYIFREDDILPPGFPDGGFLYIAVVDFYSNVLVVGAVFEGKSTT